MSTKLKPTQAEFWVPRIEAKLVNSIYGIIELGQEVSAAKEALKGKKGEFGRLGELLGWSRNALYRFTEIASNQTIVEHVQRLPPSWGTLYELSRLDAPRLLWAIDRGDVTPTIERAEAVRLVKAYKAIDIVDESSEEPEEESSEPATSEQPAEEPLQETFVYDPTNHEQPDHVNAESEEKPVKLQTFNRTNDNVGWARWTWNPVTGCLHNCDYCYARDIAERFYPQKFEPTFFPERLDAPTNTKLPEDSTDDPEWRRVFTCSMADLFGKWVPQKWIKPIFKQIQEHQEWEFLCLTKFPQRLAELEWPPNVWAGTTVDKQHRVENAERSFSSVKAGVKWLSCEPLLEPLKFTSLAMFDWVVIGASTGSRLVAPFAPPFEWVVDLYLQAKKSGCKVYLKHNLFGAEDGQFPGMKPIHEWPR